MATAKTWLGILSCCYLVYFSAVQPWLCWLLWDWHFLRPLILYVASLYPIIIIYFVIIMCIAGYLLFEEVFCDKYRTHFSRFINWGILTFGRFFFGYEVHGCERLRINNALIVYYHGVIPLDAFFLQSYARLKYGTNPTGIVDRALFNIPAMGSAMTFLSQHCSPEKLVDTLKKGGIGFVAPGGGYEALMSQDGMLEWRNRYGFARIAKETGTAVIPMFTTNISQLASLYKFGKRGNEILKQWYLLARTAPAIPKHVLPVKLKTYLGEPLYCGESETAQEFAERVKSAIELLRDKHQRHPQSVLAAVLERFGILW